MTSIISESNPLGIKAIDHLEFCCDKLETTKIRDTFSKIGLTKIAECNILESELFQEGEVRFVLTANSHPDAQSRKYFQAHGEGVSKISFLVEDAEEAFNTALKRGAEEYSPIRMEENSYGVYKSASIRGFGDLINEFIERPLEHFRPDFKVVDIDPEAKPLNSKFSRIDHLTNNVPKGEMKKWVEFYTKIYGFKVTRHFDIKGVKTGLFSEVVQLPKGEVIIPINEPDSESGKSQIQEFLDLHKGAGVQHIALTCSNILGTIEELQKRQIKFLDIPKTYYEDIPKRGLKVEEDSETLFNRQLLVDGDGDGYLLQNFTDTYIGPLFFEFIQRKNNNGFGEGNFQALFDSIERDQIERGYLK